MRRRPTSLDHPAIALQSEMPRAYGFHRPMLCRQRWAAGRQRSMSPFRWERDAATKFGRMQLVVFMPKCPLPWFAAGGAAAVTIGDGHKNESQLLFPSLP